eukprot:TRINITY_DN29068_c0_g1_i2.p1 TRINITY_DN29068_c0_g1~~TRINITY_DN29068_c0_g1_i2.p1  ORF type:complete len:753 (+),score=137.21 TRINITY_DN29068_c0_g1_i2:117-2375(+)
MPEQPSRPHGTRRLSAKPSGDESSGPAPSQAGCFRLILLLPPLVLCIACGYFIFVGEAKWKSEVITAVRVQQLEIRPADSVEIRPQTPTSAASSHSPSPGTLLQPAGVARENPASIGFAAKPTDAPRRDLCRRFVVEPLEGDFVLNPNKHQGEEGGDWNMCTHLGNYGLNTMPGLQRFLVHHLKPKSALEFGCGLGTTSDFVQRFAGAHVTCIEPDAGLLTSIRKSDEEKAGKGSYTRLGVNIFSDEAAPCFQELHAPGNGVDLVMSFEVAEHVPLEHHERLVQLLSNATKKWLVFAAARPGQIGTGHLGPSMKTFEEWKSTFVTAGLVFMPLLTELARKLSFWHRGYDLYQNLGVFRHPAYIEAEDTNIPVPEIKTDLVFWGIPNSQNRSKINFHQASLERNDVEFKLWPELKTMAKAAYHHQPPCNRGGKGRGKRTAGDSASTSSAFSVSAEEAGADFCGKFVVQPVEGMLDIGNQDAMKGEEGGGWSLCTHLRNYGLNTAPALQRWMVHQLKPESALEFGCGLGTTADFVQRFAGARVTCIEPDGKLLTVIRRSEEEKNGKGAYTRLGVNIFSDEAQKCYEQLQERSHRVDLVYTFEVAEHVPVEHHPRLVQLLKGATKKWLVFAAARPGQLGTGHLGPSMKTSVEWRTAFEETGMVYMPRLTEAARLLSYWHRGYDLHGNLLVFKHPAAYAIDSRDSDFVRPEIRKGIVWWGAGNGLPLNDAVPQAMVCLAILSTLFERRRASQTGVE